jgi:MYXO-CTERM domain-containing protein
MENFTKLGDSVYFHNDKDLWVTFYVSSTLSWKDRGLSLTQTTDLPLSNKVTITITAAPTDEVSLNFRKPDWTSTCQVGISVNGQSVTPVESGGFLSVSRVWQANDKVELAFPLLTQVSRLQDNQNAVAFTYGPIVLSAGLGTASMTTEGHGVQVLAATKPSGLQDTITINSGTKIEDWLSNIQTNLVQTPGKLEFTPKGTDSDSKLVFIPHYSRYKDRYGIYWKLAGTAGGTATTAVTCPNVTPSGTGGAGGAAGGSGGSTSSGGAAGSSGKGGASGGGSGGAGAGGMTVGSGGSSSSKTGGAGAGGAGTSSANNGTGGRSAVASGGAPAGSGGSATGGALHASGGTSGSAGASGSAGTSGNATIQRNTDCSCSAGSAASSANGMLSLLLGLGLVAWRRSRRR